MIERARVLSLAFLFDEHVNRRPLKLLEEAGVDVVHVTDVGLAGADDPVILRWAQSVGRIIVTRNYRDFAPLVQLLVSRGENFPGVLCYPTSIKHNDVNGHASALLAWIRTAMDVGVNPVESSYGWLSPQSS